MSSRNAQTKPKTATTALAELHFDPENPRLPGNQRNSDENAIIQWMLKQAELLDLMRSIAATGYSDAEPLLVTPRPGGGYTVVEGNRRLAALKLLNDPTLATLRKKSVDEIVNEAAYRATAPIPVIIYGQRSDILDYLGYRHITGTKPWGPRQKAEYLKQLFESHSASGKPQEATIALISNMIGTRPYHAKRLLVTLAIVERAEDNGFWGSDKLEDRIDSNFSVLHTALSYENIRGFIGLDESSDWTLNGLNDASTRSVLEWVCGSQKVIGDSRELKRLNSVVGTAAALAKLQSGLSLEIAAEYTGEALEDFRHFVNKALGKLTEADRLVSRVTAFGQGDLDIAKDVANLAKKIFRSVEDARSDNDL